MIPFRTSAPAAMMPAVTVGLMLANLAVFLYQYGLDPHQEMLFTYRFALVPAIYGHPEHALQVGLDPTNYWPLITNTFMHGGWVHLIFNMWTLWLFGSALEGRLPTWRFLAFYLLCGTLGSLGHLLSNLDSTVPALGASGAIAGVLGGYTRLYPRAKVTLVFPIVIVPLIFSVPAFLFTALWFAIQLWNGTAAADPHGGGIAWWAHIGGFVAGVLLVGWFQRPTRPTRQSRPALRRVGPWG